MRFDFVKLSGCRGGFELRNQIRHCKTVCIKRNLYLINYNRKRSQWTTNGNRDAGSSCSCDRGLHRYLQNFGGGGFEHPKPPLGKPLVRVTIGGGGGHDGVCSDYRSSGKFLTTRATLPDPYCFLSYITDEWGKMPTRVLCNICQNTKLWGRQRWDKLLVQYRRQCILERVYKCSEWNWVRN